MIKASRDISDVRKCSEPVYRTDHTLTSKLVLKSMPHNYTHNIRGILQMRI